MKTIDILSRILPLPFNALVVLCFFFSFFLVKCNESTLVSIEGVDLVVGTEMEEEYELGSWLNTGDLENRELTDESPVSKKNSQPIEPQPMAILALFMAIAGLILVFVPVKDRNIIQLSTSLLGLLSLGVMIWLFRQHYSEFSGSGRQAELMKNIKLRIVTAPALIWAMVLFALNALFMGAFIYASKQLSNDPLAEHGNEEVSPDSTVDQGLNLPDREQ